MTGIYRVAAVFLVVLLTGCSRGVQEASSGIEGAVSSNVLQEADDDMENGAQEDSGEAREAVVLEESRGTGVITGGEALSLHQKETLLAFMDMYYESLANLEAEDCSELFIEGDSHGELRAQVDGTSWTSEKDGSFQAAVHQAAWKLIIGVRKASGLDLRLLSYSYRLDCLNVTEMEDGCVQVEVMEYTDMRFAHTPEIDSSVTGLRHFFVLKQQEGKWYLTRHLAYDSAYSHFLRRENSDRGREAESMSWEEMENLADELIQEAADQIRQRRLQWESENDQSEQARAEHAYDREAAVAYAREWAEERNPQWQSYDSLGGNCMNFVSQCLFASGIPMDRSGNARCYWFSDANRAPAWTGVDSFRDYADSNTGYGLSARIGAAFGTGEEGDVILMCDDGDYNHAVIISQVVQDETGETIDYLICSNTGNYRDFPVSAYMYTDQELVKILGWNG